jgi:D-alanyl-lipoteichoic acid acyltransferase DltB (MBOAT superfamily)
MIFNSLQYALFLPVVVGLYWTLPRRFRTPLLLVASYIFYGAWDWRFLGLLALSTVADFTIGLRLEATDDERRRKLLLLTSVAVNLSILGFFKYADFFIDSAQELLGSAGLETSDASLRFILPVGISFYTFQTMSYSFDVYRRRLPACRDPLVFAVYVAFFPQLVAGPIERAHHLLPQLADDRAPPDADRVRSAFALIVLGLVKKVVLADQVAPYVNDVFDQADTAGSLALVVAVVGFALQIYGDFSGYTDIARGSARLLSVDLIHNFRQPYLSPDITDFWRRWHISLSNWLRDYLYIPLGGNREGRWKTYRNLMITMLLGGLWHGAGWTFIIWGGLHGLYLAVHKAWRPDAGDRAPRSLLTAILSTLATFGLVCFAWIFFRSTDVAEALDVIAGIASLGGPAPDAAALWVTGLVGAAMLAIDLVTRRVADPVRVLAGRPELAGALLGLAAVGIIVSSGSDAVPFIYFQF